MKNDILKPAEIEGITLTAEQAYNVTQVLATLAIEEIYPTPDMKQKLTLMAAGKITSEEILKNLDKNTKHK